MDSSFFYIMCAAATSFFTLLVTLFFMFYKNFRFRENNKTENSTSLSPLPPPFTLPGNWTHNVFPSFHGADVRKNFLSHLLKECKSKGIDPFIDNEITRGEFIGPELKTAIRGSKIAIVLLSKKYASSSWCLDELVEIMNCNENLGYTVMAVFYEVEPTDVKKQTGDFGKVFKKTCRNKTKEKIMAWSQALAKVATIAGYHSSNWDNEADMIETIVAYVSKKLNNSALSRDFDDLVGMGAHMEKIERLLVLRPDLDEVKMIGIWGPAGIGKTTIARCLFNRHSKDFQLSVFMGNIRAMYTIPDCSDDYDAKLHLQQKFMSQIIKEKDIEVPHLGVAQDRLKDKRVLVVLDDVDHLVQLEAMAKETRWFGHGSRIIITTQDLKLLKAHGISHIYKVPFPPTDEALQIFCMYAFEQKYPKYGFKELAWEITLLAGKLPLGLRVMGSYFRGLSKKEWENELPLLRNSLDGKIEKTLMFSYNALCERDKYLFLHLCFFNFRGIEEAEGILSQTFPDVRHRLDVLADKSLISIETGKYIEIHSLLIQLGREIVRKEYPREPGQRQFLVDTRDICEVLSDDNAGGSSVIGLNLKLSTKDELYSSERAFERMSNLQFLKISGDPGSSYFPQSLKSISKKIRVLEWYQFPMTCLPSNFNTKFLVKLGMPYSKLEKLWDGDQPLRNLMEMDLDGSKNLKELPDLSTATNLETLLLQNCLSLVELPSSIGNATSLKKLNLSGCSSLVKLPSSIGNATNLQYLDLSYCSSLVEFPSFIGNFHKLWMLTMKGCSWLKVLPININLKSLNMLDFSDCSLLRTFPEISTNIEDLYLGGTAIEEVPSSIRSWSRLESLEISYFETLKEYPHVFNIITKLHLTNTEIQEIGPWVKECSRLRRLVLKGMQKLVSLPQLPDSLKILDAENCVSLERLDCSFRNPDIQLNFGNCFKLNQEARDLIIRTSTFEKLVLPGGEVPACFTYRASGSSLTVELNEKPPCTLTKFKACVLLVNKGEDEVLDWEYLRLECRTTSKSITSTISSAYENKLSEHLYMFEFEREDVTGTELVFEFKMEFLSYQKRQTIQLWKIKECGIIQLLPRPTLSINPTLATPS